MALDPARITWRLVGEVLLDRGLVTGHDLDEALAEQARTGTRLGEILIARGLVSAAELADALAQQLGLDAPEQQAAVLPLLPRKRRAPAVVLDLGEASGGARRQDERSPSRSLLFLPGCGGYRLVERDGPPPAPGAALEIEEGRFQVVKVGRSPLPADRRRCAVMS